MPSEKLTEYSGLFNVGISGGFFPRLKKRIHTKFKTNNNNKKKELIVNLDSDDIAWFGVISDLLWLPILGL
jgi:hypothetical protein